MTISTESAPLHNQPRRINRRALLTTVGGLGGLAVAFGVYKAGERHGKTAEPHAETKPNPIITNPPQDARVTTQTAQNPDTKNAGRERFKSLTNPYSLELPPNVKKGREEEVTVVINGKDKTFKGDIFSWPDEKIYVPDSMTVFTEPVGDWVDLKAYTDPHIEELNAKIKESYRGRAPKGFNLTGSSSLEVDGKKALFLYGKIMNALDGSSEAVFGRIMFISAKEGSRPRQVWNSWFNATRDAGNTQAAEQRRQEFADILQTIKIETSV